MKDNKEIESLKYFLSTDNEETISNILENRIYITEYNSYGEPEVLNTWTLFAFELTNDGTIEIEPDLFYQLEELIEEENEEEIKSILIANNCALDKLNGIAFWFDKSVNVVNYER